MYIITSKLNSTFGTIGKATGSKMIEKEVGKLCFSVKNNLNMWSWSERLQRHGCKLKNNFFFLLNRFLRLSLNENLLLLNFLVLVFHLVPSIWEF